MTSPRRMHRVVAIAAFGLGVLLIPSFFWLTGGSINVRAFRHPSYSMSPTLLPGDFIVTELSSRKIARQDLLLFTCHGTSGLWCVKRAIGLPGDAVEVREHRAFVNGRALDEPYATIEPHPQADSMATRPPVVVPPGHVWMLGDNRAASYDSRFWGFLSMDAIHGRPTRIYWSWDADSGHVRWGRIGRRVR